MDHDRFGFTVERSEASEASPTTSDSPDALRRTEVSTGAERGRNWSRQEKLTIVAESMVEGVVISDVARRNGLSPRQLFSWRSQFKGRAAELRGQSAPKFAAVMVDDTGPAARRLAHPSEPLSAMSPSIEVTTGQAKIVIRGAVDQHTLAAVLKALEGLA